MAATGHPELYPLGGAVTLESTLSSQSLFDTSTQAMSPSRLAAESGCIGQEEPRENICKVHLTSPTRATDSSILMISEKPEEQKQSPSEKCGGSRTSSHPQSLTQTQNLSHHNQLAVNAISDSCQAVRTEKYIMPTSLPVHRSHSGTLPLVQQVTPRAPDTETCGLVYHRSIQEAEKPDSVLVCKQPMQLQKCNIITTVCQVASRGEGSVQQAPIRCVCVSSPRAIAKMESVDKKDPLPHKCDKTSCCGSYNHHSNFEDTFAAYCHPQPIPAPSQLLPHPVESSCDIQLAVAPTLTMNQLTLPRLISSVSETGLDAKHLLQCCNLSCSWINTLPPGAGPQSQKHSVLEECCSSHVRPMTQDMGTMTAHKELRDVGVQVGQSITPHVFPRICLAEESRCETSYSKTPKTDSNESRKPTGTHKSPVKEVKWDAEGMTWEVYGASVDPEELGLAIQRHLELQIKETASHAAKMSRQNTNTSQQSRRKRKGMIGSIRTPACCTCATTAVD